jgi:IMP dehydrogenase
MKTFNNTTLVPRIVSEVKHRKNCDTSIECLGIKLDIPIIASPMPDVCNGELAFKLAGLDCLGIIHRFQSIEEQVNQFSITDTACRNWMGCSIGITGDYKERFKELFISGCRIFCLDTANGANKQIEDVILQLKIAASAQHSITKNWEIYIIAGNVATKEGFEYLQDLGVDAIRVGIGSGSVCSTKTETGVYMPTLESVLDCKSVQKTSLIIADGGIKVPADMCKALVAGADLVMAGKIFAGYKETPGNVLKLEDGSKYKTYRGAASFSVQQEFSNEKPDFNEGNETLVPYVDDSVAKVIKRFKTGLQSSMSYMNSTDLKQYRINARLENL